MENIPNNLNNHNINTSSTDEADNLAIDALKRNVEQSSGSTTSEITSVSEQVDDNEIQNFLTKHDLYLELDDGIQEGIDTIYGYDFDEANMEEEFDEMRESGIEPQDLTLRIRRNSSDHDVLTIHYDNIHGFYASDNDFNEDGTMKGDKNAEDNLYIYGGSKFDAEKRRS